MKVITRLTGMLDASVPMDEASFTHVLHHEVAPGCFLFVKLAPTGLVISNGAGQHVGIPLDELVQLASFHEPAFKPKF